MIRRTPLFAATLALCVTGAAVFACSTEESGAPTHSPGAATDSGGGGDANGDSAAGCLAEDGTPPDCSVIDNGCDNVCNDISQSYTSGVARDVTRCLVTLPNCDDPGPIAACVDQALAKACNDPGVTLYCTPLVAACAKDAGKDAGRDASVADAGDAGDGGDADAGGGNDNPPSTTPFDESVCETIMKGLSPDGRQTFASCLSGDNAGQCSDDPGGCVDGIKR